MTTRNWISRLTRWAGCFAGWGVRAFLLLLIRTFYRVRVRGLENLQKSGPALLVSNHVSLIDAFLVGTSTGRSVRFLMERRFYERPGIHWLAKLMGAIPISESDPPRRLMESIQEARARLQDGQWVVIFAEGAMTRTGNLLPFRPGLERILRGTGAPIVPIYLDGVWGSVFSYEGGGFFSKWPRRFSSPVTVSFGPQLPPDATAFEVRQAILRLSSEAFANRDVAQRSLPELFLGSARRNWGRLGMADSFGRELSFGQALVGAMLFRRWVHRLASDQKMIGVLLPPSVPAALLNLGISLAGRVPVNLNYTSSQEALAVAAKRCGLQTIFTSEKLLERFSLPRQPGMVMAEELAKKISRTRKVLYAVAARLLPHFVLRAWLLPQGLRAESLATVIFSSGSTGVPKGVMLSHRNIVSNIEGLRQAIHLRRNDCLIGILPFFHSFGFTCGIWLPLLSGFRVVFHTNPLESRRIGDLCRKYRVTLLMTTPTFCSDYVRRCSPEDFASLRFSVVGAEKMKPELAQAFQEKFGVPLYEGYGCTELSPIVAVGTADYSGPGPRRVGNKPGTVGHPIPGVAVRVVHPDTFLDLGSEQEGMLLVKSPGVMMGYLGEPEKTRRALCADGSYITGDIARVDKDGFITLIDRLSRFSKIGGEMVPHLRVEDALSKALGSTETKLVVTSLPDDRKGEKLIVLHTQLDVDADALIKQLVRSGLPKLWVPRKENFFRVEAIPLLGSGKLDLCQLKEMAGRLASKPVVSAAV